MGTCKDYRALKEKADKLINLYNLEVEKMKIHENPDPPKLFIIQKNLKRLDNELQGSETRAKAHRIQVNLRKTQDNCQSLLSAVDEILSSPQINGLDNLPYFQKGQT